MEIVVDGENLVIYISKMLTFLDSFHDEIIQMQKLKEELIWESPVRDKIISQYDTLLMQYVAIGNKLITYIEALNDFMEEYNEAVEEVKDKFKKIELEYDVEDNYGKNSS